MKVNGWTEGGVSAVTSTWNEWENIVKLIQLIRDVLKAVDHEVIVIDEGSPNGTFQAARELADVAIKKRKEGQTKELAGKPRRRNPRIRDLILSNQKIILAVVKLLRYYV